MQGLRDLFHKHRRTVRSSLSGSYSHVAQHHIELRPGTTPSRSAPRVRRSEGDEERDRQHGRTLLEQGLCFHCDYHDGALSNSITVAKADGDERFCIDFRGINIDTVMSAWPSTRRREQPQPYQRMAPGRQVLGRRGPPLARPGSIQAPFIN